MSFSITPVLIIEAAKRRNWGVRIIDEDACVYRLDIPDGRYFYVRNITSKKNYGINTVISDRKDAFHQLALDLGIQVPETVTCKHDDSAARTLLEKYGRVVVKPIDQAHGKGVTVNVSTPEALEEAIEFARSFGRKKVMVQQQITGDDYRVLLIDKKLAAAAIRKPAYVVGDGVHTIIELINIENSKSTRSAGYHTELTSIDTEAAYRYLGDNLQSVPEKDIEVQVVGTANIGRGGVAFDVTDTLSSDMVEVAQKIANHLDMGLCGVDFLVTPEGEPYLIEVNAAPTLGMHEQPFRGEPRKTPDLFLDWLIK